jgi:hypothetical protein
MRSDKIEELDQALLPRRRRTRPQPSQSAGQQARSARDIGLPWKHSHPGQQIRFGIIRRMAGPERGFDQAARIEPGTIALISVGASSGALLRHTLHMIRSAMAALYGAIRPRHASRLCHRQAADNRKR